VNGSVAAIVAAAGISRRMGSCKQLLDLGGETVLGRCLGTLLAGGIDNVVVVVGLQGDAVAVEARRFPVQVAVNHDPAGDMASSVRVGRQALAPIVSGVIVALCDYPLVAPSTIAHLAAAHSADPTSIHIPCHAAQKGHPTLFPLACLDELAAGGTLRDVVRRDPQRVRLLDVDDPGILQDMDTPEDYLVVRERLTTRSLVQNEDDQRHQRQIEE
jgi:CTP:molybdopterin cytidylyltransferase MocA